MRLYRQKRDDETETESGNQEKIIAYQLTLSDLRGTVLSFCMATSPPSLRGSLASLASEAETTPLSNGTNSHTDDAAGESPSFPPGDVPPQHHKDPTTTTDHHGTTVAVSAAVPPGIAAGKPRPPATKKDISPLRHQLPSVAVLPTTPQVLNPLRAAPLQNATAPATASRHQTRVSTDQQRSPPLGVPPSADLRSSLSSSASRFPRPEERPSAVAGVHMPRVSPSPALPSPGQPQLSAASLSKLTPAQLERLHQARDRNAKLKGLCRDRDVSIKKLELGTKEIALAADVEVDCLTNAMLRRLNGVLRRQTELQATLNHDEHDRQSLERKLSLLTHDNARVAAELVDEERVIKDKLTSHIAALRRQGEALRQKVVMEEEVATSVLPYHESAPPLSGRSQSLGPADETASQASRASAAAAVRHAAATATSTVAQAGSVLTSRWGSFSSSSGPATSGGPQAATTDGGQQPSRTTASAATASATRPNSLVESWLAGGSYSAAAGGATTGLATPPAAAAPHAWTVRDASRSHSHPPPQSSQPSLGHQGNAALYPPSPQERPTPSTPSRGPPAVPSGQRPSRPLVPASTSAGCVPPNLCSPQTTSLRSMAIADLTSDATMLSQLQLDLQRLEQMKAASARRLEETQGLHKDLTDRLLAAQREETTARHSLEGTRREVALITRLASEMIASHEVLLEQTTEAQFHQHARSLREGASGVPGPPSSSCPVAVGAPSSTRPAAPGGPQLQAADGAPPTGGMGSVVGGGSISRASSVMTEWTNAECRSPAMPDSARASSATTAATAATT